MTDVVDLGNEGGGKELGPNDDGWWHGTVGWCWKYYSYKSYSSMNGIFALFSLNAIMCIGGIDAIFCLLACNSFMSVLSVVRKIRQGYKIILVSIVMINQFLDIRPTADGFLPFSFLMFLQLFCTPFCLTLFLFLLTCVLSLLLNHFILLLRSNEK